MQVKPLFLFSGSGINALFFNSMLKSLERRHWFFLVGLFFWMALDVAYRFFVSPVFSYAGFVMAQDIIKYAEACAIFILLLAFAPARLIRPSDFFINLLFFALIVPLLLFYALSNQSREHLFIVLLGYVLVDVFRRGAVLRLPVIREGSFLALIIVSGGALFVSLWLYLSGGVRFFNLDLGAVYEYRRGAGSVINIGPMGYLNTWAYKVFGPALLAIALWRRNFWLVPVIFGLHLYWFGVSAHKSVLFFPVVVLFLWVWFRRTSALGVLPLAMAGVVLASHLLYLAADFLFFGGLLIRRAFFVVAANAFDYYEFFSAREMTYWSNSIMSRFLDYPYDLRPARLIGAWRQTESHVNTTFLATGYMHAGILGVTIYGMAAGILLRLFDSLSMAGIPVWVAVSILFAPGYSLLLAADLPAGLFTHGVLVGLLVLFLIRKSINRSSCEAGKKVGFKEGGHG